MVGHDSPKQSWTEKLASKLKRRSHDGSDESNIASSRDVSLDEAQTNDSNPFARNYVASSSGATARPDTTRRSVDVSRTSVDGRGGRSRSGSLFGKIASRSASRRQSVDQGLRTVSRPPTSSGNVSTPIADSFVKQSPSSPTFPTSSHYGVEQASPTPGMNRDVRVTPSGIINAQASPREDLGDVRLDQSGRAVRKPSLNIGTGEGRSQNSASASPTTRGYTGSNTVADNSEIRRKEVPSISHQTSTERNGPVRASAGRGSAVDEGVASDRTLSHKPDVPDLNARMQGLAMNDNEARSPGSFHSAHENYFDKIPEDQKRVPTAEEILEKSKFNSADTTTHEKWAPAVTHETIHRKVHEITEERVTRDIHHYHHVHRIQPLHEVEILPARHFRVDDITGQQIEMRPEEVAQSRIDAWQTQMVPKVSV